MSAADQWVTEPRPGRITTKEAARLATSARAARIIPRGVAREVLNLLLRLTRGSFGIERSTRWIASELGIDYSAAKRSLDALVVAEILIVVVAGTGRTKSAYVVDVDRLRTLISSADATATNPGHPSDPDLNQGMLQAPPDDLDETGIQSPPDGDSIPPRGGFNPPLYARARSVLLPFSSYPLPPTATASTSKAEPSPAASRGDPLRWRSQPEAKCPHGRTRAQGGCRRCQTNSRGDPAAEKRAQAAADAEQQIRHLANTRAADAQDRAVSVPPPADWRHR